MYRKIVMGCDGSDQSKDAFALRRQLAAAAGSRLAPIVIHPGGSHSEPDTATPASAGTTA
jgi:hypothetical protein